MDNRITNSSLNTYKTCCRKYFWSYVAFGNGIAKEYSSAALTVGTAVHEALDVYVQLQMNGLHDATELTARAMEVSVEEFNKTHNPHADEETQLKWYADREMIRALVAAYIYRWTPADAEVEWLQTETEIEAPIINPQTGRKMHRVVMGGKIDKLLKRNGKIVLRDHKTTGESIHPGSTYFKRLLFDSQMSHYMLGLQRMGIDVDEIEYDVIRKPKRVPKKLSVKDTEELLATQSYCGTPVKVRRDGSRMWVDDEPVAVTVRKKGDSCGENYRMFFLRLWQELTNADGQNRYFLRHQVPRTANMMDDYAVDLHQSTFMLRESRNRGWWSQNTSQCNRMGVCPFINLCASGIGVDADPADLPDGFRLKQNSHEELSGKEDEDE